RRYVYTDAAGAVDAEIAYRYDRQGNLVMRTSEVDPYSRRFRQWYEYDERGLLERVFAARSLTRPAQPEVTYTYTATGAVASVAFRGSSALPYTYNSRDWLTGIGNVAASSGSFAAAYLHEANGQIAESEYRQYHSPATFKHYKYVYDYDRMGRLLGADSFRRESSAWANGNEFDVFNIAYDANGNLKSLRRRKENGSTIDNLSFSYTSGTNKLNILTDAAGAQASWDASTMLYAYDQRGNVTYREDFGRSHIDYLTYDELNRLTEFKRMGAVPFTTAYRYSAGGERYWKKTA